MTAVTCLFIVNKRKRNSKEKKRNIKLRKIDKRKRKNISPYMYHNIDWNKARAALSVGWRCRMR